MDLFVYGTLRAAGLMSAVSGSAVTSGVPAELAGYGVFPVQGDVVPFIAAKDDGVAPGVIYENLSQTPNK